MKQLTFDALRKANVKRAVEWTSTVRVDATTELLFRSNELAGEAGEAANKVKKMARARLGMAGGKYDETSVQELAEELADVVICADRLAEQIGRDLGEIVREKFNKTSNKHGFKATL